ncbi:two-component system response regulator [Paenibacillus sp. PCH8]|uniref:response regulator n=1 Tax=Paenibacillus sp. PCH8 TaxID=2066524 RepID=UPI000CF944CD|nr:response regulator [Paenibacillus sp. PCH8]PQP83932.1 two-component system response regulator [Paenibacillus sp. PCH8]
MEPLNVLIVDDEYLIRNLLRMRIDWEKQGMRIVGEASNAQEALEWVDQQKPDIIFTDIYMPKMDGIELSRLILEKHPDIKIVVVTGHDEFEYARKSIQIGIVDFILKPIRSAELLTVTDKLKAMIGEERKREAEVWKLRADLEQNFPYLREKFLLQWLNGTLTQMELREKAVFFNMPMLIKSCDIQVAVVEIRGASQELEEPLILLRMKCSDEIESFYQGEPHVVTLTDTQNRIVIIVLNEAVDLTPDGEALIRYLTQSYPCSVSMGIGRQHGCAEEVEESYQEACRALHYQAFVGKNQVVYFEDMVNYSEQPYQSNAELLQQLQFCISTGSSARAVEVLNDIFNVSFSSVTQFRFAAMDVITECQRVVLEQQIESVQVFNKEAWVSILEVDHLPELRTRLEFYVRYVSEAVHSKNEIKEDQLISQVKAYLEDQLGDPQVGLASTAAFFFVSPGHLGRLMKKETGKTFVEYLTNLRMKKAKTLLIQTELKGYEIGERVGIRDPQYFSVLFKKSMGRSMNEYRQHKS